MNRHLAGGQFLKEQNLLSRTGTHAASLRPWRIIAKRTTMPRREISPVGGVYG
jgi:hypothetical protein